MNLNGVEIKNLKEFTGHDGDGYWQGDVWLNGKKLGFWSNDAWCGPDHFGFDVHLLDEACRNYKAGFPDDYRYKDVLDSPDVFMGAVQDIKLIEKDCKKDFRKGAKVVFYMTDGYHVARLGFDSDISISEILDKYPDTVHKMEQHMYKSGHTGTLFRPDSFNITVDAEHPVPVFLKHI